jgi:hypothetical protein
MGLQIISLMLGDSIPNAQFKALVSFGKTSESGLRADKPGSRRFGSKNGSRDLKGGSFSQESL